MSLCLPSVASGSFAYPASMLRLEQLGLMALVQMFFEVGRCVSRR